MAEGIFSSLPDNLPGTQTQQSALPEELRGKSAEEVFEAGRAEFNRVTTEMKAQFADQIQKMQGQGGEQQQRQQQTQTSPPNTGAQRQYSLPTLPNMGGQGGDDEEEPNPVTDPERFLDKGLARRVGPYMQSQVAAMRAQNAALFEQRIGAEEMAKYKDEIEQFVGGLSPIAQAHPNSYQLAYNYVRSQHLDEIVEERAKGKESETLSKVKEALADIVPADRLNSIFGGDSGQQTQQAQQQAQMPKSFFQTNTGVQSSIPPRATNPIAQQAVGGKKPKLSAVQRDIAEAMEMTEEEYVEWAKLNTDVITQTGGMYNG